MLNPSFQLAKMWNSKQSHSIRIWFYPRFSSNNHLQVDNMLDKLVSIYVRTNRKFIRV